MFNFRSAFLSDGVCPLKLDQLFLGQGSLQVPWSKTMALGSFRIPYVENIQIHQHRGLVLFFFYLLDK